MSSKEHFLQAISNNDYKKVVSMTKEGNIVFSQDDLFLCVEKNQEKIFSYLFNAYKNKNIDLTRIDFLLQNVILAHFSVDTAVLLIKGGANINSHNHKQKTPLMMACQHHPKVAEYLISLSVDVNAQDNDGWSALMVACHYNAQLVDILISLGADVQAEDNNGYTPLMISCQYSPHCASSLLEAGAKVDLRNAYKSTPLIIAARHQPSLVPILLDHGADIDKEILYAEAENLIVKKTGDKIADILYMVKQKYKNYQVEKETTGFWSKISSVFKSKKKKSEAVETLLDTEEQEDDIIVETIKKPEDE